MGNISWEFYKDVEEKWRWRKKSANSKIVGASSEGFSSRQAAVSNAELNGYQGS